MKLSSYVTPDGRPSFGIVVGSTQKPEGVIDLGSRYGSLRALLNDKKGLDDARSLSGEKPSFAFTDVKLLPVIPDPDKIFCIGTNFMSHILETGREIPKKPMIFTRFAASQAAADEDLLSPKVSDSFDYEGELAVIIGRKSRYVEPQHALERVAGYSIYNDASVRDWQRHTQQFAPGKNFPKTGAFGPWMVTTDELPDVPAQTLKTRLNGREVQSAVFSDFVFDVPALVSYCSYFITLEPGDVIITGTTGGVGAFHNPPLWMKPGDRVEVEISGIGVLRNGIAKEESSFAI